jgi:cell division protease FtsH
MMGVERKSLVITDEEKKNTAYHEAGHALVAVLTPQADPVHKVTIIPRGMALGLTMQLPLDDKHCYNKEYLEAQLAILMGAERKSMVMSEAEKRNTAYHEAGHALVAAMLPNADPLHKVTIIPRGMALGVTMQLPIDDKHSYDKDYLLAQLAILMAGRIAEEKYMHHMTTGAGNDIERATDMARKMVCEWGMSELGPLSFGKKEEQIFLGREIAQHRDYSEETAIRIDEQVKKLVQGGYNTATGIIDENSEAMVRVAETLLEREILDGNEVMQLIKGHDLPPLSGPKDSADHTQQVIRPEGGRRVPGLSEGSQPA